MKQSLRLATWLLLIAAFPAGASSVTGVHVKNIIPNNAGVVQIYLEQPRSGMPSCATNTPIQLDFSVSTPAGQAILAGLYLAFASDLPIDISGTGQCDVESGIESIGYVSVHR
ncbi:hypothetical protein [Asticcacaulis sp. 201]|uniref:hypothetical protein n=1 Tax=Asticcacaulis sp. 201 TaxID=3028787 RepID=UPI0029161707|nr:hypothetical protein [Asticcacaulis sp. 201]MDV6331299.1 hypothetical protein [Asticcacaulis sp. 201]